MKICIIMFVPLCWGVDPEQEWTVVGRRGKPVRMQRPPVVEAPDPIFDETGWTIVGKKGKPVVIKKSVPAENTVLANAPVVSDDDHHIDIPHDAFVYNPYFDQNLSDIEGDLFDDEYGLWVYPVLEKEFDTRYLQYVDKSYQNADWMFGDLNELGRNHNYRLMDLKCDIDVDFIHKAMSILNMSGKESKEISVHAIGVAWIRQDPEFRIAQRVVPIVSEEFGCPKQVSPEYYIDSTRMKEFRERLSDKSSLIKYLLSFDEMDGFACMFLDVSRNYIIYEILFKLEMRLERLLDEGRHITLEDVLYATDPNPMALAAMAVSRGSDWTRQVDRLRPEVFEEYSNDIWEYFDTEAVPIEWLTDLAKRVSPRLLGELFESAGIVYAQRGPPSLCIPRIGWALVNLLDEVHDQRKNLKMTLRARVSKRLLSLAGEIKLG